MLVVGFAILLSGMINGYFAAGTTAAILAFVLSVAVPAPASAIPDRLAGWALAAAAGTCAVMLLWPPRAGSTLRADAARACQRLAELAGALRLDPPAVAARADAARKTVDALRKRLTGTPRRLTGPTGPAVALSTLIDEVGWLCESLAALARSSAGGTVRRREYGHAAKGGPGAAGQRGPAGRGQGRRQRAGAAVRR